MARRMWGVTSVVSLALAVVAFFRVYHRDMPIRADPNVPWVIQFGNR